MPKEITISNFILNVNQPIKVGKKKEDKLETHTYRSWDPFHSYIESGKPILIDSRTRRQAWDYIYIVHGTILILKVKLETRF